MARIQDIPFNAVKQVADGARAAEAARRSCVRISVVVEQGAPSELVYALKDALMPATSTGLVHVEALGKDTTVRVNPGADLAIVVAGEMGKAASASRAFMAAGVPCAIVVETSVEAPAPAQASGAALIAAASSEVLLEKLADWMAQTCNADIALATNFEFVRKAVAHRCVANRSAQNAAVALLPLGSADMPVMTANQALMALDIAGAYGKGATVERAAEMGVVVGCAFASRAAARAASKVFPGLGLIVKPLVAFGATTLLGRGLTVRFEAEKAWKERSQPQFSR